MLTIYNSMTHKVQKTRKRREEEGGKREEKGLTTA